MTRGKSKRRELCNFQATTVSITISHLVYQLILFDYNWNGKTAVLIDRYKQNPDFICLTDTALVNAAIYPA